MTGRIFLKLIIGVFALLLLALITVDYVATNVAQENYVQNLTQQLTEKGHMLALTFPSPESLDATHARLLAQAVGGRITVVRADGKVLLDTEANAADMENHGSRKEVREAFQHGAGSEIRQSATIGVSFLYVAVPVANGASAIRIAFPLSEMNRQIARIRGKILVSTSAAFLPAILIAAIRRVSYRGGWRRLWPTPGNWRAAISARACRTPIPVSSANSRRRSMRLRRTCSRRSPSCSTSTPNWKNWSASAKIS